MSSSSFEDRSNTPFGRSPTLSRIQDENLAIRFQRASRTGEDGVFGRESTDGHGRGGKQTQPYIEVRSESAQESDMVLQPLLPARSLPAPDLENKLQFAYTVSWIVNIALFLAKGYAYYISHSKSVLASLVDSFVDLISQVVIFFAEWQSKKADPRFPVGKARLETIGVLACACIMSVSAYAVIQDSATTLYEGLVEEVMPDLDVSILMYSVLGAATALKLVCYILCVALQSKSDSMLALAEDHLNDIISNVGAAATSAVAAYVSKAWWADAAGGILISLFILWRWYDIAKSQLDKIVGKSAPEEMLEQLKLLVDNHHTHVQMDCIRAYHCGARFFVEAEVVMPVFFTLKEVHDISLHLQHKLEAIPEVERAFVHVDYEKRYEPEHRVDRMLAGLPMVLEEQPSLASPV